MVRHAAITSAVLGVIALTAACGSASFEFSFGDGSGTVEEAATYLVENDLSEQIGEVLTADCPAVPDPEVGTTFSCTGTTDDGVVIEFAGIVDREDHIDLNSTNLIVADQLPGWAAVAEESVESTVGFDVTVDCGERFVVLDDDSGWSCEVTDPDGVTAALRITNADLDAGTFDWVLDDGS